MDSNLPAFESHGGKLEVFNDGHIPETFQEEQTNDDALSSTPRIVRYDAISTQPSNVYIYDGILNPNSARMLYEVTATSSTIPSQQEDIKQTNTDGAPMLQGESPWGTYVTIQEALEWLEWKKLEGNCLPEHYENDNNCSNVKEYLIAWRQYLIRFRKWQALSNKQSTDEKKEENIDTTITDGNDILYKQVEDMDYIRHSLAVEAVSKFFLQTIPNEDQTGQTKIGKSSKDTTTLFQSSEFIKQAHGVAVWALSSNTGNSVQYHIDYAELLRYEYNVTVPPLYAGTIQCSQLWNDLKRLTTNQNHQTMKGGEFCVNLQGLDHYSEHGYKGNISGDSSGGWRRPEKNDNTDQCPKGIHTNYNSQWVTIPYAFNRGIVHRGDSPHLSAPVESISDNNACPLSRVIVGFNVFGHDVGERISKAPEHSKTFRRKVRMYRSTINTCKPKESKNDARNKPKQTGMDISQIRKNRGLTKLLILAKREKVKQELRHNQEQLSCKIWNRLLKNHAEKVDELLTVADILHEFGSTNDEIDGAWPKSIDVHVHLHHLLLSTKSAQDVSQQNMCSMHNHFQDSEGVLGSPGAWYYIQTNTTASSQTKQMEEKSKLIPLTTLLDITRV